MRSTSVVQVQVSVNSSPGFTAIAISSQICLLVFDAPPQMLYKNIVQVSTLPSHADLDPPRSSSSTSAIGSWYRCQTARRVRHKLQVYQCPLNRRVSQPARQVVDGDAVHQQVPCVAVAQRVSADLLPRRDRAQFLSAFLRRLHPAPGCRGMRIYDSALADVSVSQGVAQARAAGGNASFYIFSCIGYECQTFHLKKGMCRRHTLFVVVPG